MFTSASLLGNDVPDVRVGIGCGNKDGHVGKSVRVVESDKIKIYRDPAEMIDDLKAGRIDAAVRGDMSSSKVLPVIHERFGIAQIERLVILEPRRGKVVFMAPVGIDEGRTVDDKYDICVRSIEMMKKLGAGTKIGVMSGGRADDYGRHLDVDRSLKDAEELVKRLKSSGYDAYNAQILIEEAVEDADLIITPDGISGNLIFRTMHFIGGANALGAPVLNINKVFVDTSRVKIDYTDSIRLAMRLAGGMK